MNWKNVIAFICSLFLVAALMAEQAVYAAGYESINQITLKEAPYKLENNWSVDPSFTGSIPNAVVKGNNGYLAVGPYGSIIRSKNGRDWKTLSKFGNYHFTAAASNGSNYIVFGTNTEYDNQAWYFPSETFVSSDGLKWNKVEANLNDTILYATWGNNEYVAVGRKHIYTSKNGESWSITYTFNVQHGYFKAYFENGKHFIYAFDEQKVLSSSNGEKWSSHKLNKNVNIESFIWAKNKYIAVGDGIFTSSDGVSWKKQSTSPKNVYIESIITDGSKYIALGFSTADQSRVAYTSTDATNWKKQAGSNFSFQLFELYPVSGGFAGLAANPNDALYAVYSKDGVKWSNKLVGMTVTGEFTGVATNGKRTVAVGSLGGVAYTDDGKNWTSASAFPYLNMAGYRPYLLDIAWGANKFVAVGNGGVYTSTNGTSWKKQTVKGLGEYNNLSQIWWTGSYFIAADQVAGVYASKDGITWTKASSVSGYDYWLTSLVADGKRAVATFNIFNNGNSYSKIMQTTNGTSWTTLATLKQTELNIAWNGKKYIVMSPYAPNVLWHSTDAKTWTKHNSKIGNNVTLPYLTVFDGHFVAFNNSIRVKNDEYEKYSAYYVSKDGLSWRAVQVPDKQEVNTFGMETLKAGVKAHGRYIFVGDKGYIMSTDALQYEEQIIIKITVDGKALATSAEKGNPFIDQGTTYLPLRLIGEALDFDIKWDQKTKVVTFSKGEKQKKFSNIKIKNNISYVPLREVSEGLGYKVGYKKTNNTISISIESK